MSIIHEALKKIEADRGDGASAFISQSPGRGRKGSPYLRLILLIFVLFFAAGATILYKDHLNMEEGKTLRQPGEKMRGKIEGGLSPSPESSKQENVGFKDARERNLKGIALFNAGNVKGAIEEFRAAVNQSPSYAEAYNNLGQALMEIGRNDDAEVNFKKALQLRPDYPEGLNNYGAFLNGSGKSREATEHLRRAIDLRPTYPDPYLNLAISFEKRGRLKEAITNYNKYLDLTGGDTPLAGEITEKIHLLRRIYLAEVGR